MNAKYTNIMDVYARVTALLPSRKVNPADIVEWAAQCETEWIQDYNSYVRYLKVKLDVQNKKARIPYFKVRILDVYSNPENRGSHVNYYDNGSYLILDSNYEKDYIYINFIGIAIDEETGLPMIKKGHEEACVRHIICNLYYEDYLNNKIDQNRWNDMLMQREIQVRAAQADIGDYSRKDLEEIKAITLSMIPVVRFDSFYHEGLGG